MKIHKRALTKWLTDFVAIASQVRGESFETSISLGRGILFCPNDVFDLLRNRRVLSQNLNRHIIDYNGRFGRTFVEVRADVDQKFDLSIHAE